MKDTGAELNMLMQQLKNNVLKDKHTLTGAGRPEEDLARKIIQKNAFVIGSQMGGYDSDYSEVDSSMHFDNGEEGEGAEVIEKDQVERLVGNGKEGESGMENEDDNMILDMDLEHDEEMLQAMRKAIQQQTTAEPQVRRWTLGIGTIGKAMQRQQQHQQLNSMQSSRAGGSLDTAAATAKNMLGAPTLIKQLETVLTDIESLSSSVTASATSPLNGALPLSPKRKVTLFSRKTGEKKRLIEKYKAHLLTLEGERKSLSDKLKKASATGGVALGMLKQEWTTAQLEISRKVRELEKAQDLMGRHEAESTQLRTTVTSLRRQIEELHMNRAAPSEQQQQQQQKEGMLSHDGSPAMVSASSTPLICTPTTGTSQEVIAKDGERLAELEIELDLAYGKLEALSMQQNHTKDRSAGLVNRLQGEIREAKAALVARVKKHTEVKERCRQLEEELGASVGQIEAVKHQMELRVGKIEERLKESMREALENERTAKNALFKRQQAEEEMDRLREQYDVLVGQFEAIRSQVELEKMEAKGTVAKYEKELEDVYGKLNAKDEYAGLLCGVRKDMDSEMTDLWTQMDLAEEKRVKLEEAFVTLGNRYRAASARRLFNFMVRQHNNRLRETLIILKKNAKAPPMEADMP
ncbi:Hypothetical protein NocV09_00502370 [Nannochloropsis oceanica]